MEIGETPFDHHSAAYVERSHSILRRLRAECPVAHTSAHGGYHVATRYRDVAQAARDDVTYSSAWLPGEGQPKGIAIPPTLVRFGFIMMDPPESLKHRRAINPLFSPAAVERLLPRLRHHVTLAIDEFIEKGRCDLVHDLADRVPAMATIEVMGLDLADWRRYVEHFHHSVSADATTDQYRDEHGPDNWVIRTLREAIRERRVRPRGDGLTYMINQPIDGVPMTDESAVENLLLILVGGFDTSAALLSNALLHLSRVTEDRDRLVADPALLETATEEFLRYFSPVQNLGRTVTRPTVLGDRHLELGDRVLLCWASANLDEEEFAEPERILLERFPNRHQAFGLGTHRCAGSHLARAEFKATLTEVLKRLPDYRVLEAECLRYPSIGSNNGWMSMPAVFTPGPRSG